MIKAMQEGTGRGVTRSEGGGFRRAIGTVGIHGGSVAHEQLTGIGNQ